MSPGIKVRALPSTIRTVARLPFHCEAGPSNGSVHCESLRSFWAEQASPSHPKAKRRQSKSAIFTPFYLCWSKNRKADQPDQKITLGELRQYSSRSRLVGRNPESYCDHRVLLLRVR